MFKLFFTSSSSGDTTLIAADCQITGSITINGNGRIDGKIEGSVHTTGDLIIGANAILKADIESNTASISGVVHGNIKTTGLLELTPTAHLFGDICTRQLKIEQGAHFTGMSKFLEEATPPSVIDENNEVPHLIRETKRLLTRA